ncbi:MAG: MATE family efflux transporter [Muribaculaceae bacterium]|nr:MATE family efflux transporter [Roseburia sp.]MCM1430593.1 MATE family efflux transporter [Muribaculaceae bacterium]MCM1492700.1 MATE family efflux transporter [Muribaculaceae bacterium]
MEVGLPTLFQKGQVKKMRTDMDMLHGSLGGKIIRYTLPLAATGILQQLFNAADIAVVGRFAGKEAMAAVGSNSPVIGLLVNLFVGISLGSNVIIAKAIGQDDKKSISRAVHTSIIVALLGGIGIAVLGELLAANVVALLGVPGEVFAMAVRYLRIYLLGMPVILLYNFEAAIFRSCGNTRTPLIALVISGVSNVLLNLFFVCVLGMDVDGVALATVIANLVSSAILFTALLKTDLAIQVTLKNMRIDGRILSSILKIGVPAGVQGMIFSFANIVIQSAVNSLGTTVMAASSAAFNLEIFAYYVMNSFGQACTTFVGQNFGAGQNDRCIRTLKLCLLQSAAATAVTCGVILFFGKPLLGIFNQDPAVIDTGYIRLCYIFAAYLFSFAQEGLSGYLRGYGVSFIPAACSVVGICGVRLVWIFTVFQKNPAFATIMQVYPISLGVTAVAILLVTILVRPSRRYRLKRA